MGCLFVFLLAVRLVWGWEANRRLQSAIDQYAAAGQPVYSRELQAALDAVPEDENAAILLEQAMDAIVYASAAGVPFAEIWGDLDNFEEHRSDAKEIVEENRETLELVNLASAKRRVAWSIRLDNRFKTIDLGNLSEQRSLAKLLVVAIHHFMSEGDQEQALSKVSDLLFLADAGCEHPLLLSNLVGIAINGIGNSTIERIAPRLHVETASRDQIQQLIVELLEEETLNRQYKFAFYGERAYCLDMHATLQEAYASYGQFSTWRGLPIVWGFESFVKPVYTLDTKIMLTAATATANAPAKSTWQEAKDATLSLPLSSFASSLAHPMLQDWFGSTLDTHRKSLQIVYKLKAGRRMAATALAIRLFVVDHGKMPVALEDLVPNYLASVPADPFAVDGASIRYRPNDERPLLYSIGVDGIDDDGQRKVKNNVSFQGDIPFYLAGEPKEAIESDPVSSPNADNRDDKPEDDNGKAYE